jgi:hypothetical protein
MATVQAQDQTGPARSNSATIIRDQRTGYNYWGMSGRRMSIFSEDGQISLGLDIAPREIEFDGLTWEWATLDRVGFVGKLVPKWHKLRTLKFETTLTSKTFMWGNIQDQFDRLRRLTGSTQRMLVNYSRQEVGAFYITECSFRSILRDPLSNDITRATMSMTLTEANEGTQIGAGAVWWQSTGINYDKPDTQGRPRTDVRPGDTLQSVAARVYGNPGDWVWLYALNTDRLSTPWADLSAVTSLRV